MPHLDPDVLGASIERVRPFEPQLLEDDMCLREDILQAYREQVADEEAEREALEWSDALIGDAF